MKSIKTKIILSFVIILTICSIVLGYISLNYYQKTIVNEAEKALESLVKKSVELLESRIETQKRSIEIIAGLESIESMDLEAQIHELQNEVEKTNFLAFAIVHADGNAYYNDGTKINLGDREYVKKAFRGETNISDIIISKVTGKQVVIYATPIRQEGKIVGVLIGRRDGSALSEITDSITYGATGYGYIVNNKGIIRAHKNRDFVLNEWNPIEDAKNNKELESLASMIERMISEKSGLGSYTFNNKEIYNGYGTIEGTNWILAVAVEKNEVLGAISKMTKRIILSAAIIVALSILISYFIGKQLAYPIISSVKHAEKIATLDLTSKISDKLLNQKDETGKLAQAFDTMQKSLRKTIVNIKEKSNEVSSNSDSLAATSEQMTASSQELATTMNQVAEGATSQAQDLTDIVSSLSDLTGNIENVYKELRNVKEETENTENKANIGKQEMDILIKSIEDIKNAFEIVVGKVETLTRSVNEISGITEIISGISEQTNLLALNAAIEAARAGEHGRGFAVVAEEVRKLAEESGKSTEKIVNLVNSIIKDTDEVISTSKEVEKSVKEQTASVENTVKSFGDILLSVENIAPLMKKTYDAMDEIVKSKDIVMGKVEGVSAITEENSAATEEVAASSEELTASSQEVASTAQSLSEIANDMMEAVNRFKV